MAVLQRLIAWRPLEAADAALPAAVLPGVPSHGDPPPSGASILPADAGPRATGRVAATGGAADRALPLVQRSAPPPVEVPDAHPGLTALANGLASRGADGSVVFSRLADESAPAPPPASPPASAVTTSTAPAGARAGGAELDELAGRLYDRIRFRLRSELHLDRERAGLVTDL
jgi:hypothetical protein